MRRILYRVQSLMFALSCLTAIAFVYNSSLACDSFRFLFQTTSDFRMLNLEPPALAGSCRSEYVAILILEIALAYFIALILAIPMLSKTADELGFKFTPISIAFRSFYEQVFPVWYVSILMYETKLHQSGVVDGDAEKATTLAEVVWRYYIRSHKYYFIVGFFLFSVMAISFDLLTGDDKQNTLFAFGRLLILSALMSCIFELVVLVVSYIQRIIGPK